MNLPDTFEVEAVFVRTQPASEGHAIAVECNDVTIDLDVPADFFTKPRCYAGMAVLPPTLTPPDLLTSSNVNSNTSFNDVSLIAMVPLSEWRTPTLTVSAAIALYRTMEMRFWLPQTEAALSQVG